MTEARRNRMAEIRAELEQLEQLEIAERRREEERRQAERLNRHASRVSDLTEEDLFDPEPRYRGEAAYVLPFGREYSKWNPLDPDSHPFGKSWLAMSSALIVKKDERTRPTRIIHSSGLPSDNDRIGNRWTYRHDQTNHLLGDYEIVGIVVYGSDGEVALKAGNVPTTKMSLNTYK